MAGLLRLRSFVPAYNSLSVLNQQGRNGSSAPGSSGTQRGWNPNAVPQSPCWALQNQCSFLQIQLQTVSEAKGFQGSGLGLFWNRDEHAL
jgi:hypothetical protein